LKAPYQIGALVKAQLSDIKPGLFIGAAAVPGEDGALKAMEVHIFPETMRGTGAGFRPFDLAPQSSMTNGSISALVDTVDGPKLTVAYKGGEQSILVDKATPIVGMVAGGLDDIKPGARSIAWQTASSGGEELRPPGDSSSLRGSINSASSSFVRRAKSPMTIGRKTVRRFFVGI
jgi:hypothetical protein